MLKSFTWLSLYSALVFTILLIDPARALGSSASSGEVGLPSANDSEKIVTKRITIIVGEEDVATAPAENVVQPTSIEHVESSAGGHQSSDGDTHDQSDTREPEFRLNEGDKLIYIDRRTEIGYLVGEIVNKRENGTWKHPVGERSTKDRSGPPSLSASEVATNFSVHVISREKQHIAILIDFEQVDLEPMTNCEPQEIKFSIVGEISKQLGNSSESSAPSEEIVPTEVEPAGSVDGQPSSSSDDDSSETPTSTAPTIPVSEAMAILLNSPLNRTILDEVNEANEFRIIDATIDYLHDETCHELTLGGNSAASKRHPDRASESEVGGNKRRRKKQQQKGPKRRRNRKRKTQNICRTDSSQYKELMSSKLDEYFEWDDFKVVCGKTRKLLIPMRSMKISIYGDEFSTDSKFKLKYKFISDPAELPGLDNGKYYCRNRNVIDLELKCDGVDDCGDASDESDKICGYVKNREKQPSSTAAGKAAAREASAGQATDSRRKLTYLKGDLINCCQSSEWLNLIPQPPASQALNLQSLIGESMMNLFAGPSFAPTKASAHRRVKRIVGGGVAQRGVWPAQVSLSYELLEPVCHFCAGTLVHPQYVLTAGHCISKDGLARGIKVVLGAHDLRQQDGNHVQIRYVDDAHIYPGVDPKHLNFEWENDMNNDIALLRLNAPVLISANVAPACLPPFNTPLAVNTSCKSIGWGQTHGSGSSNLLKHLTMKVHNSTLCARELHDHEDDDRDGDQRTSSLANTTKVATAPASRRFPFKGRQVNGDGSALVDKFSDNTMICVNNARGQGICQGDSGGPLYCDRLTPNGETCTEIYGVASFIIQYATVSAMCAVENLPGIFGEVSSKTEWVSSTIKMFEQQYRQKYS